MSSISNSTNIVKQGWADGPDRRSTFGLLYSCLFTIFTCTWTVVHQNLPKQRASYWWKLWRKIWWMIIAVFAPEFISAVAASEWIQARETLKELRKSKMTIPKSGCSTDNEMTIASDSRLPVELTLAHGHFVNMGGVQVRLSRALRHDINDTYWESNSSRVQVLCRMITTGSISLKNLTSDEIESRSHSDALVKCIAVLQSVWLVTQIIARMLSQLPITELEIATTGYVLCSIITYIFWWNKPFDVLLPFIIEAVPSLNLDTLEDWEAEAKEQKIEEEAERQRQRELNRSGRRSRRQLGYNRLRNPDGATMLGIFVCLFAGLVFCGVHIAAWNFTFPTLAELTLWRIFACLALSAVVLAAVFVPFTVNIAAGEIGTAWCMIIFYAVARTYLLGAIFASLRWQPVAVYDNVNWTALLPHV